MWFEANRRVCRQRSPTNLYKATNERIFSAKKLWLGGCIQVCFPTNVSLRRVFPFLSKAFQRGRFVIDYCVFAGGFALENPLRTLLNLPDQEKVERGLVHTPREIFQQPDTWHTTYKLCKDRRIGFDPCLASSWDWPRKHLVSNCVSMWEQALGLQRPSTSADCCAAAGVATSGLCRAEPVDGLRRISPRGKGVSMDLVFPIG